jgi:hypothetical protein
MRVSPRLRGVSVAAAALALVVVVATVAPRDPLRAERWVARGWEGGEVPAAVVTGVLGLGLLGAFVTIVYTIHELRRRPFRPAQRTRRLLANIIVLLAVILALAFWRPPPEQEPPEAPSPTTLAPADEGQPLAGADLAPLLPVVAVAVIVLVVLLALARRGGRSRRSTAGHDRDGVSPAAALAGVDQGLAELATGHDPRSAIIAAYVALLRALDRGGVARRPDETPLELVERALSELSVREEPLSRLTALFSEARFSTHALDEGDRDQAAAALSAARDDLERCSA